MRSVSVGLARVFTKINIAKEVIPSIRETGGYSVQPPKELTRLELIQMAMDAELAKQALQIQVDTQAQEIEILEPKAQALDRLENSDGTLNVTEASSETRTQDVN